MVKRSKIPPPLPHPGPHRHSVHVGVTLQMPASPLQDKCNAPELLLVWLFQIGPTRLLVLAAVLAGAKLASFYDLGPVYILLAIIITIFTHLGHKKEGEASAYSVFNPGVQRLPGQLDADVIDQQIRRGQI